MKTKFRKYSLAASLAAVIVLCSVLGTGFVKSPSEASAEESDTAVETLASTTEDVNEEISATSWGEGITWQTGDKVLFEYSETYGGYVVTGGYVPDGFVLNEVSCTSANIPDTITVKVPTVNNGLASTVRHTYPVVRIEDGAFYNNTEILSVRVGKYVEYVGSRAFYGCYGVESLEYLAADAENGGGTSTGYAPFYFAGYKAGKNALTVGADVERIDAYMFYKAYVSEVVFAEGARLKEIGKYAFNNLKPVSDDVVIDFMLPDTVEKVGEYALSMTVPVRNANVPAGLKEAGKGAFGIERLSNLFFEATDMPDLSADDQPFYGLGNARYTGNGGYYIDYDDLVVYIGKEVTRIPDYCFYADVMSKSNDSGAYIWYVRPEYVYEKGSDDGTYALSYVGAYAFWNCGGLRGVTFPSGVEEIGEYAFGGYSGIGWLTSVKLGDTAGWYVTEQDGTKPNDSVQYWFGEEFMSDPETVATYFRKTYPDYRYHCSDGFTYELSADGTYYTVTGYSGDGGDVTVKDTHRAKPVSGIGDETFIGDTSVVSVVIPESVERIGSEAFSGCTKLSSVTIRGSGLETVGSNAFYNCTALKSLYVSGASAFLSVDYDGRYANPLALVSSNGGKFYVGGDSYTSLSINDTDKIGTYALAYCTLIKSVAIGDSVETIGECAFYGETSLSSIAIPASVTYIGENAFSDVSLSTVTFASNSGWTVTSGSTEIKLAGSELQANAKDFLTSTYAEYVWTRTVYDHSAPTVESKTASGGYTNSDISITTTVDGGSSIWYIAYTDPSGNTYCVYDHSLTLTADGTSGTVSRALTNGLYMFVAVDADGIESDPYYITFDNVAPDLYVGGMAAWVNYSSTEFSVMAYDESPVTLYSSRDGGATWTLCASNPYTVYPDKTFATDGEYWFKAEDAAGNVTGPYYTVLDTMAVTGEWETGDDLYPYFYYEVPSYTEWTCTMNGEPYASGTKLKTCQTTYYVTLVGKNGTTLATDYTLQHLYPEDGVYTEPTCSAYGYTTYSCVFCNDSYIVVDLHSTTGSHNYEERRVEPTCTEKGSYWYVCVDCGDSTTPVDIDALGHDPVADQMIAATCTTEGYTGKICSRCGVLLEGEITAATGHNYLAVSYSATCVELAKTVYTCSVCGDTFEVTTGVYLADHVWGDWTHESPTCTETGFESRQCEVCGETEEYVLKATGHSYTSAVWHEWTDENTGKIYRYRYCDVCGETDWYDADDPTEVASNGVIDIFKKYQQYMWWIFLAFVGLWSIVIGIRWALQRSDQERVRTRSMLANYIIGLFVIAIILVGLPYLIYGIAVLVA